LPEDKESFEKEARVFEKQEGASVVGYQGGGVEHPQAIASIDCLSYCLGFFADPRVLLFERLTSEA
jgi:hypothetical protein